MTRTADELSQELSSAARAHPDYFWSFLLIDASVMIRELAGLPALTPPMPRSLAAPDPVLRCPKRPGSYCETPYACVGGCNHAEVRELASPPRSGRRELKKPAAIEPTARKGLIV